MQKLIAVFRNQSAPAGFQCYSEKVIIATKLVLSVMSIQLN